MSASSRVPVSSKFIGISGASAGIGAACARELARAGHRLFLGARRLTALEKIKRECLDLGACSVDIMALDVTKDSSVAAFADKALTLADQKIDVLINNAGLALGTAHVKDGDITQWQTVLDTNVMGVMRLTRALLPAMVAAQRGHLVFLSSIAAHQVYEGGAIYCASKFAIRALAQTLKLELNGTPIRVSTIDPGMVETEFSVVRFAGDTRKAESVYRGVSPLTGSDIAECVAFMISRPAHVNIDQLVIMPTDQATVYKVNRKS